MQLQFDETKELLMKERKAAKEIAEKVPVIQEVSVFDHEIVNKLTAENEQLKVITLIYFSILINENELFVRPFFMHLSKVLIKTCNFTLVNYIFFKMQMM